MSIRVMTAVWDKGKRYEGGTLLVLLALADWADDGGRCFPSVRELAEKSRLTERQVFSVLKALKSDGVLAKTGEVAMRDDDGRWRFLKGESGGRGRFVVYRINTEMLSGNRGGNPEKISGKPQSGNPEVGGTETLKSAPRNPEICDTPPHPLLGRTVSEPSVGTVIKNHSPYPLASERAENQTAAMKNSPAKADGERNTPSAASVDAMSWGRFRYALKLSLGEAPLKHPNFREIVPGEWDFDTCFRDWWLIGLAPAAGGERPRVLTDAENLAATREGLRKYRKRIEALMREHFGAVVEIEVRERAA